MKIKYDQVDTPLSEMCFNSIIATHSVYYMNHVNYLKNLFESIPDYKKIVLFLVLIKNDVNLLTEYCFLKIDCICLCLELETLIIEQSEDCLHYNKK